MQAFYGIGIQIELKYLIVNIGKGLQIAFAFDGLSGLIALRNIHTDALKLGFPSLVDAFSDPSENMRTGSVTAKQGHISGDRSISGEHTVKIFGKSAALLHWNHQEYIAFIQFQIIHFSVRHFRETKKLNHLRIDICNSRLLFAGISQKSARNGFIQKMQIGIFVFHVGDIC